MLQQENNPLIYKRHPFAYLVEAADDICYILMDRSAEIENITLK